MLAMYIVFRRTNKMGYSMIIEGYFVSICHKTHLLSYTETFPDLGNSMF